VIVTDGRALGATGSSAPWTAALDPVANLRALGDIQRRGLVAASELIERLTATDAATGGPTDRSAGGGSAPGLGGLGVGGLAGVGGLDALAQQWAELARRWLQALAQVAAATGVGAGAGPGSFGTGVAADVADISPPEVVRLTVRSPGRATTAVWLHNGTSTDRRELRVHCGELRADDGEVLASAPRFEPASLDRLPAGASGRIDVCLDLGRDGVVPRTYRGVVLVHGLPDAWLPIEVMVEQ
jgi:hypothetical protein